MNAYTSKEFLEDATYIEQRRDELNAAYGDGSGDVMAQRYWAKIAEYQPDLLASACVARGSHEVARVVLI